MKDAMRNASQLHYTITSALLISSLSNPTDAQFCWQLDVIIAIGVMNKYQ